MTPARDHRADADLSPSGPADAPLDPPIARMADWSTGAPWRGVVDGLRLGTTVTVLFYTQETPGKGAALHVHDYDEVFIVREGRARYTIGDRTIDAEAGDVVLGPANVPHKFVNLGPGRLETTDIHLGERWVQTDLPDPDRDAHD